MYVYVACCFYVCCSDSVEVCGNVCCVAAVVKNCVFFSIGVLKYVVYLCSGCDGCCFFCLFCEVWSCRCWCMGSVSVSSCICCMFVSCVHHVAVLNAVLYMICSFLMLVEDARGDQMEETYSRAGLRTSMYVAMSVSFCLLNPVAVSAFMICSCLCACTEMLCMCVLYMSFGSKLDPEPFGALPWVEHCCVFRSRLLVYSAGSGVNRVQVVLSGFRQKLYVCMVVCISWLHS